MTDKRYRVAQWGTGHSGMPALRALIEHPNFDLVGVGVYSDDKVGRDAGELCGGGTTGVIATKNIEDIIAAKPDCVVYMPVGPDFDDICRLLEAGINISTLLEHFHDPETLDPLVRQRIEEACERGGASIYSSGPSPGFITESLPLVLTSIERRLDCYRIEEFADMSERNSPEMFALLGFGSAPDALAVDVIGQGAGVAYGSSLRRLATALSLEFDDVTVTAEVATATKPVETAVGTIDAGTVAGWRIEISGVRDGKALVASVRGDDGNHYWFNIGAMPLRESWGNVDFWAMSIRSTRGTVVQPAGSVYKVADFPDGIATDWHFQPRGALTATKSADQVAVNLGDFNVVCKPDKTWHYTISDEASGISGEWVHTGNGFPTWYGKEKPQFYTPHSIAYGYFWSGGIEGTLTIGGRTVGITGAGVRERYYAIDTCPAEVGGWHDWLWFHFDELSGSLDEMKVSQNKDGSFYLTDEKQYVPTTKFDIRHYDWAYLASSGVFIPTRYEVSVETGEGVLEIGANVVSAYAGSGIRDMPDSPTIILDWDNLEGTFTYPDGHKRTLTNGLGGTLIRQWRPYPSSLLTGADLKADVARRI